MMTRRRGRSTTILLLLMGVLLAGTATVLLLVTGPEARNRFFWTSLGFAGFAAILTFGYSALEAGHRAERIPVPSVLTLGTAIAIYDLFVALNIVFSWLILRLTYRSYLATHIAGLTAFLLLAGFGLIFTSSLAAREKTTRTGRERLLDLEERIRRIKNELGEDFERQKEELNSLMEQLRMSDPVTCPEALSCEEDLKETLNTLEKMAISSEKIPEDAAKISRTILRASEFLRERNARILASK